jgi:hypothetical protein
MDDALPRRRLFPPSIFDGELLGGVAEFETTGLIVASADKPQIYPVPTNIAHWQCRRLLRVRKGGSLLHASERGVMETDVSAPGAALTRALIEGFPPTAFDLWETDTVQLVAACGIEGQLVVTSLAHGDHVYEEREQRMTTLNSVHFTDHGGGRGVIRMRSTPNGTDRVSLRRAHGAPHVRAVQRPLGALLRNHW